MLSENYIEISPGKKLKHYWHEIWLYRELFYFLAWRDILVRYKQTVIGVSWSLIRPFLSMVVFSVIFGMVAKLPSEGIPYPILVMAGTLPWYLFSSSLSDSSNSLISNASMLTKVYFPRLAIPVSAIAVAFVDFIISFVILIGMMFYYNFLPGWQIVTLPLFIIIAFIASLGGGLWFSALNVKYRDFKFIVPFVVQFGMYVSPVGFSSSVVPEQYRLLYSVNPMVGVIDGFRWAITGKVIDLYLPGFFLSILVVFLLFFSGLWYFRKVEKTFADVI